MSASPDRPIFALFDLLAAQPVKAGTRLTAPVTGVTDDAITVTLGSGVGRVLRAEVIGSPKLGDMIDLYVDEVTDEGQVVLSAKKASCLALNDRLEQVVASGELQVATVLAVVRGGLAVSVLGVKAFLPGNRLGQRAGRHTDWIGRQLEVRILTLDGFKGRIEVASPAAAVTETVSEQAPAEALPTRSLTDFEVGQVLEARVSRLARFGAFVDLGGVDGLIALSELDWGRPQTPRDVVQVGTPVQVKVLAIDTEKNRISLSRKALQPDPWLEAAGRYAAGTRATGTVVGLTEFGAFVAIEPGVEGLVHISELHWGATPKKADAVVQVGQVVEVEVLEVDGERRRLRLSMRRVQPNPWQALHERYPPGTRLRGPVRSVTDFGVFLAVEDGIDGLVHVSDMEWGQSVRDPASRFRKGDELEVMVLHIDTERQRLSLGIKQLTEDKRPALYAALAVGSKVVGTIARVVDFGAFIALSDGLEGLLHRSALGMSLDTLVVGQTLEVVVLAVDFDSGRIGLGRLGVEPSATEPAPVEPPATEPARSED